MIFKKIMCIIITLLTLTQACPIFADGQLKPKAVAKNHMQKPQNTTSFNEDITLIFIGVNFMLWLGFGYVLKNGWPQCGCRHRRHFRMR